MTRHYTICTDLSKTKVLLEGDGDQAAVHRAFDLVKATGVERFVCFIDDNMTAPGVWDKRADELHRAMEQAKKAFDAATQTALAAFLQPLVDAHGDDPAAFMASFPNALAMLFNDDEPKAPTADAAPPIPETAAIQQARDIAKFMRDLRPEEGGA